VQVFGDRVYARSVAAIHTLRGEPMNPLKPPGSLAWGVVVASVSLALALTLCAWVGFVSPKRLERPLSTRPAQPTPDPALLERLKTAGTPVQRDFANGTFRNGDHVERLLQAHAPALVVGDSINGLIIFQPADPSPHRGRSVVVVTMGGKLLRATTRVEIGPGQYEQIEFFGEWVGQLSGTFRSPSDWGFVELGGLYRWNPEIISAHMAVAGAAVVGGFVASVISW
jgi:hypothetical protein